MKLKTLFIFAFPAILLMFCAPVEFAKYSQQWEIDMRFIFDFQLASVPTGMLTLRSLVLAILVSALTAGCSIFLHR